MPRFDWPVWVGDSVKSVKITADVDDSSGDHWYVTTGAKAVGPVALDLLTKGIEAGKVPVECFVRHEAWKVWRPLADIASVKTDGEGTPVPRGRAAARSDDAAPTPHVGAFGAFADMGRAVPSTPGRVPRVLPPPNPPPPARANDVRRAGRSTKATRPPPPPAPPAPRTPAPRHESLATSTDDITEPGRLSLFAEQSPSDVLAGSGDLQEAMTLLMAAVVQRSEADAALLHRVDDHGATVACAHGPLCGEMLGSRTRLLDAAVVAAAGGHMVVAEPTPGPAGEAVLSRLARLGVVAEGAVMIPVRTSRKLLGMLELGRRRRFTAAEIAALEGLVSGLALRAEAQDWD